MKRNKISERIRNKLEKLQFVKRKKENKQFCKIYGIELKNKRRLSKGNTVTVKSARMQGLKEQGI